MKLQQRLRGLSGGSSFHHAFAGLDQDLALGSHPPTPAAVERLSQAGFRSIVNLAQEGEDGQHLSPNVEASWAHTFEMEHRRVSVDAHHLSRDFELFLEVLDRSATPIYVHSTDGQRAIAFCAAALALRRLVSTAEALEELAERGLKLEDPLLRGWVEEEVGARSGVVQLEPDQVPSAAEAPRRAGPGSGT